MGTKVRMDWDTKRAVAEISGMVANGMDQACQFVRQEAMARAPKRTGKMAGAIEYVTEVDARGNTIEGRVGNKAGGGTFYEYFVELGTSKMGARPHLRPAVFENGATIVRLIGEG